MNPQAPNFVPKVHPASRSAEPEDPMTLTATVASGDPEVMLRCVVQEYAWMGWRGEQILALFRDPGYPALNALREAVGEDVLQRRICAILEEIGVFHVRATVYEAPLQAEPEVVQISMPSENARKQMLAADDPFDG